jgi:ferredoxin
MLAYQKLLPHPVDFWASSYHAEIAADACSQCGTCVSRCQVGAVALAGPSGAAKVNLSRCIGCGLCVATCPAEAIRLKKKRAEPPPPANEEAFYDQVRANKKGAPAQLLNLVKVALKIKA